MENNDPDLRAIIQRLRDGGHYSQPPLPPGRSSGTSGDMGPWEQSVEKRLDQLHADVRNLLFGLIGGFLVLAGGGLALHWSLTDKVSAQQAAIEKLGGELAARDAVTDGKIDRLLDRGSAKK